MSSSEAFARVVIYRYYTLQSQLCWGRQQRMPSGADAPPLRQQKKDARMFNNTERNAALQGRGAASS